MMDNKYVNLFLVIWIFFIFLYIPMIIKRNDFKGFFKKLDNWDKGFLMGHWIVVESSILFFINKIEHLDKNVSIVIFLIFAMSPIIFFARIQNKQDMKFRYDCYYARVLMVSMAFTLFLLEVLSYFFLKFILF